MLITTDHIIFDTKNPNGYARRSRFVVNFFYDSPSNSLIQQTISI